jgi:hypothetical protein
MEIIRERRRGTLRLLCCGCPVLFDGRILIEMQATPLAPEFSSAPQNIVLPCRAAAFSFDTLVRTVKENKPPLSANQSGAVNIVGSQRFDAARPHRFFPFWPVRKDDISTELVEGDDMTSLMNHRLAAIFF